MSHTESSATGSPPTDTSPSRDRLAELPDIYIGGVRSTGDRPETIITEVHGANKPEWSRKRAVTIGLIVGVLFGSVFFAGYAGTSAWICSSQLDCGHWAPIAIVSSIGAASFMVAGGFVGYFLHAIYKLFKVT